MNVKEFVTVLNLLASLNIRCHKNQTNPAGYHKKLLLACSERVIVNETIVGQEVWTQVINGDCRPLARDF